MSNLKDSPESLGVPALCALGLPTIFCVEPSGDDRHTYSIIGRSRCEPDRLVVQDMYSGDIMTIGQYDTIYPPLKVSNDAG